MSNHARPSRENDPQRHAEPTRRGELRGHADSSRRDELRRHAERLQKRVRILDSISRRFSRIRLWIVITGGTATYVGFQMGAGWFVVTGFILAFALVARWHRRLDVYHRRALARVRIKHDQIARLELDWDDIPLWSDIEPDPEHPFWIDLNLTGARSLHHLLDTASSAGGSARLVSWLTRIDPDQGESLARQQLVRELEPATVFRDRLRMHGLLSGEQSDASWEGEKVQSWLSRQQQKSLRPLLRLLSGLALLNWVLVLAHIFTPLPALWSISLLAYVAIYMFSYRRIGSYFDEADDLQKALTGFREISVFLENTRYGQRPLLAALCSPFRDPTHRPSTHLSRIGRIAAAASSQKSELWLVVLNVIGPWDVFFADRLEKAKESLRADLPVWLDTWYELEAHASLASFAYLNPEYAFPEILSGGDSGPMFRASQLGHPLLPRTQKICNDVDMGAPGEYVLMTGSNMSGKSTFLRTIGANLCLAYAGAPVNASSCTTRVFRLFTCINISDSIADGFSYFYAEVRRLATLLRAHQAPHPLPLFFLIDEIFRGTNNRERLIGSRSYIRALAGGSGSGIIATHDLELTALAGELPNLRNQHFRDDVQEGRMVFDYRLHEGPCPTTNALKIMTLAGLPVEPRPRSGPAAPSADSVNQPDKMGDDSA